MVPATEMKAHPRQMPLPGPSRDFCQLRSTVKAAELPVMRQVRGLAVLWDIRG